MQAVPECICLVAIGMGTGVILGTLDIYPPYDCTKLWPHGVPKVCVECVVCGNRKAQGLRRAVPQADRLGAYVSNVVVAAKHRGQGIGKKLVMEALDRSTSQVWHSGLGHVLPACTEVC